MRLGSGQVVEDLQPGDPAVEGSRNAAFSRLESQSDDVHGQAVPNKLMQVTDSQRFINKALE